MKKLFYFSDHKIHGIFSLGLDKKFPTNEKLYHKLRDYFWDNDLIMNKYQEILIPNIKNEKIFL